METSRSETRELPRLERRLRYFRYGWTIVLALVLFVAIVGLIGYVKDEIDLGNYLEVLVTGVGLLGVGHSVHSHRRFG